MKKLSIKLKLWQLILIVIGGVFLAVGGAVLYVGLTSGIGAKDVYPEDVSFVIPEEDESYNTTLGQFEESEDFSLTIGSNTESVNKKKLQLSFTKNFTETADEDGFISSGAITIPQYVTIGEAFTVKVNKATKDTEGFGFLADGDSVNIGGISDIYAMTENKVILPTSTKVAIDIPVYEIKMSVYDVETNEEIAYTTEDEEIVYNIVEGTQVKIKTTFLPAGSQYLYSDNFSDREEKRTKNVYYEITDGQENFAMTLNGNDVILTASGNISSRAQLQNYVFKNSLNEINFNAVHENDTDEQKYSSAVQYLSNTEAVSVISELNFVTVQANVTAFNVSRTEDIAWSTNKLLTLSANAAEYANYALGMQVIDDSNKVLKSMIKNIGIRVTNEAGEETPDVKVVGGNVISAAGKNYTLINSSVMDMNYAYWEVSSSINNELNKYTIEVALLLHDTEAEKTSDGPVYYVYETSYTMDVTFKENVDSAVEWKDNSDIEMVIYKGSGSATEYTKNLNELVSVPTTNTYQTVVFFANIADETISSYTSYLECGTTTGYTIGEDILNLAEIAGGSLLIRGGIADGQLKIYFATVKTDAYGTPIKESNKYKIISLSGAINIKTIESVSGINTLTLSVDVDDTGNIYETEDGKKQYILAKGKDEFKLNITLESVEEANLFKAQQDRMTLEALSKEENKLGDILEQVGLITQSGENITYTLKVKSTVSIEDCINLIVRLTYNNGIKAESYTAKVSTTGEIDMGYIVVYDSKPYTINNEDLKDQTFKAVQNPEDGTYIIKKGDDTALGGIGVINGYIGAVVVKDRFNRTITEECSISVSSNNENVVAVSGNTLSITPGATGNAKIFINSGEANLTFTIETTSVKVVSVDVGGTTYGETAIKNGEIEIEVVGEQDASIVLGSLLSNIIISNGLEGEEREESEFTSSLYFKIDNITSISSADKEDLYAEMLEVNNPAITDLSTLVASTEITKFTIKEHFGTDVIIPIRVGADIGIDFVVKLVIKQNISLSENTLKTYAYQQGSSTTVTIGNEYSTETHTAVYAAYPITIANALKATVTSPGEDWTTWASLRDKNDETSNILTSGKITFPEVYAPTEKTYVLYSVDNNPYGIKYTINCKIYPNFTYSVNNYGEISITNVKSVDGVEIKDIVPITRYVYISENEYDGTFYSVKEKGEEYPKIDEGKIASEKIVLTKEEGLRREFTIAVKYGEDDEEDPKKILDYTGSEISPTLYLTAGFTYDEIVAVNSGWIYGTVTYNSKEYLLAKYSTGENTLNSPSSLGSLLLKITEKSNIILSPNPFIFRAVTSMSSADGLYIGTDADSSFIRVGIYKESEAIATVYLPIMLSTIGNLPYVYYENYNDGIEEYDLSTITDINKTKTADLYTAVEAGQTLNIIQEYTEYIPNYVDVEYEETATDIYTLKKGETTIIENVAKAKLEFYVKTNITLGEGENIIPVGVIVDVTETSTDYYRVTYSTIILENVAKTFLSFLAKVINTDGIYRSDSTNTNIELSIAENYIDADGVALASINSENELVLKDYAGTEPKYIIVQVKIRSTTCSTYQIFYYRLKVSANVTTSVIYPSVNGCEYLTINGSEEKTLTGKFSTTLTEPGNASYKITSISVGDTKYNNFDKGNGVYQTEKITITIVGDKLTFNTTNTVQDINVTLRKVYDNIVDGGTDYFFNINGSAYVYSVEYQAGEVGENSTWTINPANRTLNVTTKRTSSYSNVTTSVDTSTVVTTAKFYEEDGTEFTPADFDFTNGVLTYTAPDLLPTENQIVKVKFIVTVYRDSTKTETIYSDFIPDTELTVVVNAKTKITESNKKIVAGTTYNVLGDLISEVYEFNTSSKQFVKNETPTITSVTCDKAYITCTTSTISIPAMSIDTDVVFTIKINGSTFKISRTIAANIKQENGTTYLATESAYAPNYAINTIYYAGDVKEIPFTTFASYTESTSRNGGAFSIANAGSKATVNGVEFTLGIKDNDKLTIKSDNVANITPSVKVPVGITYTKGDYEFTFYVNIVITIQPNVVASTNYPNPTGKGQLTAETINSGSVIDINFFKNKADFATANRVVFTKKSTTECGDWSYSVQSRTNVEVDETTHKVTLTGSNSTGTITYQIVCNKVIATYTLYVIKADEKIYSSKINGTINYASGVETIYADNIEDREIFQNDRLVSVDITASDVSGYLNKLIEITFEERVSDDVEPTYKTVKFLMNASYTGKTIYLEAGKSLTGYTVSKITLDGNDYTIEAKTKAIFEYWKAKIATNERINFYYTANSGSLLIDKTYNTSSVINDATTPPTSAQTTDVKLSLSETGEKATCQYTYKFDVDIEVDSGMLNENDVLTYITINASDYASVRDLVTLAGIKHPSTGEYISAKDFGNAESDLKIVYDTGDTIAGKVYNKFRSGKTYSADVQATLTKMNNGHGVKFLDWSGDKGIDTNKAYNYELIGEGAANNGSWVLLIYTYTASASVSRDFYIMVYIKPDYSMSVDGINYTYQEDGLEGTIISTSSNEGNAYTVKYNTIDEDETDTTDADKTSYTLNVTSKTKSGVVKIVGKNLATSDYAYDWTYTMKVDELINSTTYNSSTDISKFILSGTAIKTFTNSNGWTKTTISPKDYYIWENGDELKIVQKDANIFGTKNYVLEIENEYGYKCTFYFDLLPVNNNDPSAEATFTTITEEESFDIGAVYESLTLEPEANNRFNFYDEDKNHLVFYSQDGKTLLSYDSSITLDNDNTVGPITGGVDNTVKIKKGSDEKSVNLLGLDSSTNLIKAGTYFEYNNGITYTAYAEKNYNLTPETTNTDPGTNHLINISGINAWGYKVSDWSEIEKNRVNQSNSKYLSTDNSSIMMLPYVTIEGVSYYYNGVNITPSSSTEIKDKTLATAEGLKYNKVIKGIPTSDITENYRNYSNGNITIPTLPGWIYSESANLTAGQAYPTTDSAVVTIVIKLTFTKDSQTEYREVPVTVTINRKPTVTRSGSIVSTTVEGTVADGESFELADKFIVKESGSASKTTTYTIYDDTIVVTLPAKQASQSAILKVNGYVTNRGDKVNGYVTNDGDKVATLQEITFTNNLSMTQTFYQSLSEKLIDASNSKKTYLLKAGDTICLEYSGYEGNAASLEGKKYCVKYAKNYLTNDAETVKSEITVSAITEDKINVEDSRLFYNSGLSKTDLPNGVNEHVYNKGLSVIKSYVFQVGRGKYYRVEKEYFVTPRLFAPGDNITLVGNPQVAVIYDETADAKYTVNYATWASQIAYLAGTGTTSITSTKAGKKLEEACSRYAKSCLKVVIEGQSTGTATIDADGNITTWARYKLNGNEYVSVKVYIKASGYDGTYASANNYDHYLGSFRLFVTSAS